jgi:hypothetical protein
VGLPVNVNIMKMRLCSVITRMWKILHGDNMPESQPFIPVRG